MLNVGTQNMKRLFKSLGAFPAFFIMSSVLELFKSQLILGFDCILIFDQLLFVFLLIVVHHSESCLQEYINKNQAKKPAEHFKSFNNILLPFLMTNLSVFISIFGLTSTCLRCPYPFICPYTWPRPDLTCFPDPGGPLQLSANWFL